MDPPSTLSHDPCGTPAAGLPGPLETQRGHGPGQGPGSKVRFSGCPGACRVGVRPAPPRPARPLTLVLLHERPHVSLLWAVCEGAVPHVLALTAVLCMDAELQGGRGESLLSPAGWCDGPSQQPSPPGPQGLTSEAPMPPCTPPPVLTSYCCGKLRMDGSGRTDTHFLLALDITRRTRRSLVQLQDTAGCVTSTESSAFSPMVLVPRPPMPLHGAWLTSAVPWRCST